MINISNNLILGIFTAIFKLFELIAKLIYQILKFLKLRLLALYLLVCLFLHLIWDMFPRGSSSYDIALVVGIIIGIASVFALIKSLLGGAKFKFNRGEKKVKEKKRESYEVSREQVANMQPAYPSPAAEQTTNQTIYGQPDKAVEIPPSQTFAINQPLPVKPNYYRVAQNDKYIMAEYPDRYELFYDTGAGMRYIRTDYK